MIKRIPLGSTGLQVSAVGFGGIPITRLPLDQAAALVRQTVASGINFFDSGYVYADSEQRIAAGIRGADRADLVIATKDPSTDGPLFTRHVEESLVKLGVEYLDLMQLHNVSDARGWDAVRAPGGALEALQRLRDQGKVRHLGVTSHSIEMALEMMSSGLFETIQAPLNFVADEGLPLLELCRAKGLGYIAMKPFAGGAIEDGELALRWLQQYPDAVPIPGLDTAPELWQVVELYGDVRPLSAAQRAQIAGLKTELGKVFCHACGYCQPCPQEMSIPLILRAKSFARRTPVSQSTRALSRAMRKVEQCTNCGECLPKCPYHLDIPAMLRRSRDWYDEWVKTLPPQKE